MTIQKTFEPTIICVKVWIRRELVSGSYGATDTKLLVTLLTNPADEFLVEISSIQMKSCASESLFRCI